MTGVWFSSKGNEKMSALDVSEKEVDQLLNNLSAGSGEVEVIRRSMGRDLGAASVVFYERDGDEGFAKSMQGRPYYPTRSRRASMPDGYKPAGFRTFGEFLRAGMGKAPNANFAKSYGAAIEGLAKALGTQTTAFEDGGLLVLPEFAPEIQAMLYQSNSMWARTKQYTVAGNSMSFPKLRDQDRSNGKRHGGVVGYWLGEGDPYGTSRPNFDSTDLKLDKVGVAIYLTEEMLSDSGYAIEQFVTEVVQAEMDYMLDESLLIGDGVKKPLGILKSASLVVVPKESGQANGTVLTENILNMWGRRLEAGAGDDLVWLVNQDVETILPKMFLATGSSSGVLTYQGPGGVSGQPYATLQGRPVISCEHCPALGQVGDIVLANFKYYLSITKGQVNQVASPHVQFLNDIQCIKFTFRVNGLPMYDTPLTVKNSTNKRSAFIALATR